MRPQPVIHPFFDEPTNTVSYIVADPVTKRAAVIDPVLDYDPNSGEVDIRSTKALLEAADKQGFAIVWSLETHAHADHLSGSSYVKAKTGAKIGIGEHIKDVQRIFRPIFDATDLKTDGSDFDHLFKDGERFKIGELEAEVIYTPGHTPADITYKIEDAAFVGDTLFHARLRHRTCRLSRRGCASTVPFDPKIDGASKRYAFLQNLMYISPSTHFVRFGQAVLYRGAGIGVIWPDLAIMVVLGGAFIAVALSRFRTMLAWQS